MRCCTPEIVKATIGGFSGTIISWWSLFEAPSKSYWGFGEDWAWPSYTFIEPWIGAHSSLFESNTLGECVVVNRPSRYPASTTAVYDPSLGEGLYTPTSDIVWSGIAFPPTKPVCDPECAGFIYHRAPDSLAGGYLTWQNTPCNAAGGWEPYTLSGIDCSDSAVSFVCNEKPPGGFHFGPVGRGDRVCESDFNEDAMILRRQTSGLRPELKARVIRSSAAPSGAVNANLRFDVYCRRRWMFYGQPCNKDIIYQLVCSQKYPPSSDPPEPEGTWYCVDYFCGPRNYGPLEGAAFDCEQAMCNASQGYAWPHLKVFPDDSHGNSSASLSITLKEQQWSSDVSADPISWVVSSVSITKGGSGYSVGQFMFVDFDPAWMEPRKKLTGQYIFPFPTEDDCGYPLTWEDDYGFRQIGGVVPIQRIRISSVDNNGKITGVELVPWYKQPEVVAGSCIDFIQDKADKTKHYPEYTRILCHPQSVDIPGTGYKVGDRIEWYCTDPSCVTGVPAVAYVTDVDDNGGVLDWHIKGSDICMYGYGGYKCGASWEDEDVPNLARADCAADEYPYGEDERGAYKFDGKLLCNLLWSGSGNPVRAAGTVERESFPYTKHYQQNASVTTSCGINVIGSKCRTTIGMQILQYKYTSYYFLADFESEEGPPLQSQLLQWFLPYPQCNGGGAVLGGRYGIEANPTKLGGPITAAFVAEGGAGYAFRDKQHTQPILSKIVPQLGDGKGAEIESFSFGVVSNFPAFGYAANEAHSPSSARFSYFPVTGATINSNKRGSGYVVGQEFTVFPEGGEQYSSAWGTGGGDDPDSYQNGCWYGGRFSSQLTASGHLSTGFSPGGSSPQTGTATRESLCTLRVSQVNATGGIVSLSVVHGGMMYRTVWAAGVRHPDVATYISSDTGFGGKIEARVDSRPASATFGAVTDVTVTDAGHEYANPDGGIVWQLMDVNLGSEIFSATANLMALFPWDLIYSFDSATPAPYILVDGTMPPVIRRTSACAFSECYHSLINASYTLYRLYSPSSLYDADRASETGSLEGVETSGPAASWITMGIKYKSASPPYSKAFFRKRSAVPNEFGKYKSSDFLFLEWGQTLSLVAPIPTSVPAACPDHSDGRTNPW
jgi:hypothetical protein